jgi:hypothetical protein
MVAPMGVQQEWETGEPPDAVQCSEIALEHQFVHYRANFGLRVESPTAANN